METHPMNPNPSKATDVSATATTRPPGARRRSAMLSVAAIALAVPSLANAAKWEMTGDSGKVSVWVDRDSMRRIGNEVRARLEWRWAQPADVPDTNGARTYRLERQLQVANCSNHSFAIVEGTRYGDERGLDPVNSYKFDETMLRWLDAPSRTIRGGVVDHVCRNAPTPDATRR